MGVARQIIGLAGWLSIVSGLAAAGARPRRPLLVVAIVALTAPPAVMGLDSFLTVLANPDVLWDLVAPLPIAGVLLVIGIAGSAARAAAIVALVVGARHGLRPRLAWRLGVAAAGALVLGVVLGLVPWLPVWQSAAQGGMSIPLYVASTVLDIAFRALLLGACFAGLGRGTDERHVAMWRVFWVWGERRFRPAA